MEQIQEDQDAFLNYAAAANRSEEEIIAYSTEYLEENDDEFDNQLDGVMTYARGRLSYFYQEAGNSSFYSILISCLVFAAVLGVFFL